MQKEILKENVVEAPTLFVGVGGTGCKIVTEVAGLCKPGEVENIGFVCMDTNVNDLSCVERAKVKIYTVQTSTTQTVGDYLDYDRDALKNWFPKNAVMYDKTVSEGAGQVRAISRLALNATIKTGKIAPLYDAIDDLFRKDGRKFKQALRVVVVSTASGGTGSGIILPLSMFIRDYVKNKYPQTGTIFRSMILLPETLDSVITSAVERDSQRRNAYATIKEINAFMMKGSGFCDIEGDFKRYTDLHVDIPVAGSNDLKSLALLPCDFCFLLDGQNSEDNTLVQMDQYKSQAARALYEQNVGPMQKNAFSVEDNIIKEMSNPGKMGRNRFGGIGASVLRYPYERIAEYIGCGWAMDSIGGSGEASKWSRYDHEFEIKKADARRRGLSGEDVPKLEDVYTATMMNLTDNFSKDLRNIYLGDVQPRLNSYYSSLKKYMHDNVRNNSSISNAFNAVSNLSEPQEYKEDDNARKQVRSFLNNLRAYEIAVQANAKKTAEGIAEAVFYNDTKTILGKERHTLEFLLKNSYGEVCHPNAARFMLYKVKQEFAKGIKSTEALLRSKEEELATYSPNAHQPSIFDVKARVKKVENSLDELVKTACMDDFKYQPNVHNKLNEVFPAYFDAIQGYCDLTAESEAYKQGYEFVKELCREYERFYATFTDKVAALERKQDDIVDELKFRKGDSILNVCSSKDMLVELALTTKNQSAEGAMLSSDLNGQIFDAVKDNVKFEREIQNVDIVEEDKRVDIFDKILRGYFVDSVKENCETIDLNIINAIAMENRLRARIKTREQQANSNNKDEKIFDNVTSKENENYIKAMVEKGLRLAAPGIQSIRSEEAREVVCCAYNESLNGMRNYRVGDLLSSISNKSAVNSVSRYELHFFKAMYNITPDKLKKFACYNETETGVKNPGLYHNAYMTYARNIGPDSTKDTMISTHIDKRWDSIAVMPELDFEYQKKRMMQIHQAMIYGLVHKAITFRRLSASAGKKRVYRYENSEERYMDLIVSNGTLCDEFYEILDSLYINSFVVGDLDLVRDKKSKKDQTRNANYKDTVFYRDLCEFKIGADDYHENVASLFEIPMLYYATLPNNRRYDDEIAAVVDAVLQTLNDEIHRWEKGSDARFILCSELIRQFHLFMDNYTICEKLNANIPAADNPVIDIIYRKVKNVLSLDPEPDELEQTLEDMKARIR